MYSPAMKYLSLALVMALAVPRIYAAYGQNGRDTAADQADENQQNQQAPPEEIPDFSGLNEYIYQPKTTLNFGFRMITGIKASFSGSGTIPAPETLLPANVPDQTQTYHDGFVGSDTRTLTVDNGNGTSTSILAPSDGKTNNWSYDSSNQYVDGLMLFNVYSATTPNLTGYGNKGRPNDGMEISVAHDMADLTKHLSWKFFMGLSLNDIQAASSAVVKANVTTTTDVYDLFGQTPIPPGTTSPNAQNINVVDSNGNQVLDPTTGQPVQQSVETTVLIGNEPLARNTTTVADFGSVEDSWKVHGGYMTFRAGPQLVYAFGDHLKLSVSVGPALIYAGSMYEISEKFTPATGDPITDNLVDVAQKLVPAAYADATLSYDVTDRAGFYLGGVFQDGGSYTQTANDTNFGTYSTKIDFSDQRGVRGGLTFKF